MHATSNHILYNCGVTRLSVVVDRRLRVDLLFDEWNTKILAARNEKRIR